MDVIIFKPDDPNLEALNEIPWISGSSKTVFFYENTPIIVHLVNSEDSRLPDYFRDLLDGNAISIDFEWKPDLKGQSNPISIFQFATSKGVLIVENQNPKGSQYLIEFLSANTFFGKGMGCDKKKLRFMFDTWFNFEDIEITILRPQDLTLNFMGIVEQYVGIPTAKFKDKRVSCSNWSIRPLSTKQILYAAFDVYAIYLCYPLLPKPSIFHSSMQSISEINYKSGKRKKAPPKKIPSPKFLSKNPEFSSLEILQSQIQNQQSFVPLINYSVENSLLRYCIAHGFLQDNYCVLCNSCFPNIIDHLWVVHFDLIPYLYYPEQSQTYINSIVQSIIFADKSMNFEENNVECQLCSRKFSSYHCFFTHVRLSHSRTIPTDYLPLPDVCYSHLISVKLIDHHNLTCIYCQQPFQSHDALMLHAWRMHGHLISETFKHRPVIYNDDTYELTHLLGISCINQLRSGEYNDGVIMCSYCRTGFDSPNELFIHLFHRHLRVFIINSNEVSQFPIKFSDLPSELLFHLERAFYDKILQMMIDKLVLIYTNSNLLKCTQCDIVFSNAKDLKDHIFSLHSIIMFDHMKIRNSNFLFRNTQKSD